MVISLRGYQIVRLFVSLIFIKVLNAFHLQITPSRNSFISKHFHIGTHLKCSGAIDQENLIIPSALKDVGGGWSIQGLKPPPKQGTVWARPRPKVGEVKKMGSGSFGTIYLGTDLLTGEEVAVKAEPDIGQKFSPLKAEAEILIELQDGPGIPQVYWVGQRVLNGQNCNVMVMELLGPDMEGLLELLGKRQFSLKTGIMLAIQMVATLEHIHSRGILHRDIKPENFLMGCKLRANTVYLVDYGLSGRWRLPGSDQHVPEATLPSEEEMRGTVRFASLHKHRHLEQSRRDDVEELAYGLSYLLNGPLPWQALEDPTTFDGLKADRRQREKQLREIADLKAAASPEDLCRGLPSIFADMLRHGRELGFEDEPDYAGLRAGLEAALREGGWRADGGYDWGNKAVPKRRFGVW